MILTAKDTNYVKDGIIYPDAYIKQSQVLIDEDRQVLRIIFSLYYGDNVQSDLQGAVVFNEIHEPTLIKDGEDTHEILEYVGNGGTYEESRIVDWGRPSFTSVRAYFDLASVWTDLQFADQPLKQLAIDWLMNNLELNGKKIKEDFNQPE